MPLEVDSARLKILKSAVMARPDVRKEKVEALRQFVKSGKYHVTDLEILGVLLKDERNGSHEYSKIP